ncbi:MAG: cytochrome P450 [Anaerolineae bacterium]
MLSNTSHIQINNPLFKANPFPFYAHLRENAPVLRLPSPYGGSMWLITRYRDALTVLKNERFVKNQQSILTPEQLAQRPPQEFNLMASSLLENDGATHRRLRSLVHKAFTPQLIEHLRERIQHITTELLDKMVARSGGDLITDFAFPLPITVICEMLGIPVADRDQFRVWSNMLLDQAGDQQAEARQQAIMALVGYLRDAIEARRAQPHDDLITRLLQVEEAGDQLHDQELLAMVFLLLVAGHETTVNLIGSSILALLEHPKQLEKLRRNPALITTGIEELLRYTSPVENTTERFTSQDIEVNGVIIPKGELVLVSLASANHDPEQFPDPETLDLTRSDNKHIAFGLGVHYCLGAPLARLEASVALPALLRRLPKLELAVPAPKLRWRPSLFVRGLEALPAHW